MIGTATEVHLWRCSIDLPGAALDEAYSVLRDDEIERARRYKFARDRRRFVVARAFLRRSLAEHLSVDPRELEFVYGPFGKPGLMPGRPAESVEFNLSHSGNVAVLAVTRGPVVGIDVEQLVPVPEWRGLASRFFSAYENAALTGVAPDARDLAFYSCWTGKEAFLKALGSGLAHPLDSFDVSVDESHPRLVALRGDLGARTAWTFYHLCPVQGYVATLVVEGDGAELVWRSPLRAAERISSGSGGG